ncbi:apolipoprotein N-acyltransferase [Maridesulfovibrio sp.]|uniref:apolipoprotein N-acyltransferase n=1 Tax=Maridesulfovibrio sp. TaxID=2795000 RepID=UPI002A18D8A6|nr:apolipoprotein N-acyltransferase [Maridesulfovibrio sp.]
MPLIIPVIIAAVSAGLGYPNPLYHLPAAALGFPLALGMIGLSAPTPRKALKRGWIAGSTASIAVMYWIAYPVGVYGDIPWALALPCPVLVGMAVGTYYGVYSYLLHYAMKTMPPLAVCLFSALLWTTLETAQGILLTGFPWMVLSSAFSFRPEWIQGAAFIGAYALSGVLASITTAILYCRNSHSPKMWALAAISAILILGGARTVPERFSTLARTGNATIGIVQGNIDQASKWDAKYKKTTFDKYLRLSEKLTPKADLVVWPETAMPFYIQDHGLMRAMLFNFASRTETPILTGAPGYIMHSRDSFSLYNRAFLIKPHTSELSWYDKHHLVPFGEYVPLKDFLPLQKLVQGAGDFIPGNDCAPLQSGSLAMGVLICYEGIFPELAQERVAKGANLLINISNDAWYGRTSAPLQHLALVTLRAVEQGRYMIRCTNTGISACIDPLGRISESTGLFVDSAELTHPVLMSGNTFFHANYMVETVTPPSLTGIMICWIFLIIRKRKKQES